MSNIWAPRVLSILRIVAAFLFMLHGTQKLFAFPSGREAMDITQWVVGLRGWAGILETFGGGLLLVGAWTRPVAFILSGEMAVAYFLSHAPRNFWPGLNGGELAALYAFLFLYFVFAGGGAWSVDALRVRRRPAVTSGTPPSA